jgi:hypothetical protein
VTRRIRGIPNFRQDQQQAMATRHGHNQQGGHMAGTATKRNTGIDAATGNLVDTDTGEILSETQPEPTEAEQTAAEIADKDAATDAEMAAMLDRNIIGWRPTPGAKLIGQVTARYELPGFADGKNQQPDYVVLEVLTDGGTEIAVHCFHTALRSQVTRYDPQPGDRIGVTYKGFRGHEQGYTGKMRGYEDYRLIVRKHVPDGVMTPTGNSGGDWNRP